MAHLVLKERGSIRSPATHASPEIMVELGLRVGACCGGWGGSETRTLLFMVGQTSIDSRQRHWDCSNTEIALSVQAFRAPSVSGSPVTCMQGSPVVGGNL